MAWCKITIRLKDAEDTEDSYYELSYYGVYTHKKGYSDVKDLRLVFQDERRALKAQGIESAKIVRIEKVKEEKVTLG